jgi:hypothetical protein
MPVGLMMDARSDADHRTFVSLRRVGCAESLTEHRSRRRERTELDRFHGLAGGAKPIAGSPEVVGAPGSLGDFDALGAS